MERNKTKEQLEEEKKISLSFRIKPLAIEGLSEDKLREKAQELWELIVKLETEKYDLEERQKRQDYDVSIPLSFTPCQTVSWLRFLSPVLPLVERIEGKTETTAQAQSLEEGSRPRSFDWQIPAQDSSCLQIRKTCRYPLLRRQEEALRRCKYSSNSFSIFDYHNSVIQCNGFLKCGRKSPPST